MILAVGDSFTFGHGLADPAGHCWPTVLSRISGHTVTNTAQFGASNDYIIRTAFEQTCEQSYDVVLVQWSEINRIEVYDEEVGEISVSAANADKYHHVQPWIQDYYKYGYNDHLARKRFFTQLLGLQSWFQQRNQPYLFLIVSLNFRKPLQLEEPRYLPLTSQLDSSRILGWRTGLEFVRMYDFENDALPCGHPSEVGHTKIAYYLYDYTRNLGWIS